MGGALMITPIPSNIMTTALTTNATLNQSQIVCRNCKCQGHSNDDCYWPGGGKEGQFLPNFGKRGNGGNHGNLGGSNSNISTAHAAKVFALATYSTSGGNRLEGRTLLDSAATDYCFWEKGDFKGYLTATTGMEEAAIKDSQFDVLGKGVVIKSFTS